MKGATGFVPVSDKDPEFESGLLLEEIGGLTLILRTLLAAQRSGCSRIVVVADVSEETLEKLKKATVDRRLRSEVEWVEFNKDSFDGDQLPGEEFVRIPANCVFDSGTLRDLDLPRSGRAAVFGESGIVTCGEGIAGDVDPEVILDETRWREQITQWREVGNVDEVAEPSYWHRVGSRADLKVALGKIYGSLHDNEGGLEGILDHLISRRFSLPLTKLFARTPLTPNLISVLGFLIGLVSLYCFTLAGYAPKLIGALLLQFSSFIDHVDGEIARLKFQQSRFGGILEMTLDQILHILLMLSIGIGVSRDLNNTVYIWLGAACLFGALMACIFVMINQLYETRILGLVTDAHEEVVESQTRFSKLVETFGTREFSYYLILVAALNLLPLLLWVFAFGSQVFWLILAFFYVKEHLLK